MKHAVLTAAILLSGIATPSAASDPRDDASPWGIAPGAEARGEYQKFNPLLEQAGVKWLRFFLPWNALEPQQGQWAWEKNDALIADTKAHSMHTLGYLGFLANWASTEGKARNFPIKDIAYWSNYVEQVVGRYHKDIKYWEVWNEFNGGFAVSTNKPKDYAELTRTAYVAAKKIDPTVQIGISCANFDLGFFDKVIKAGAANHFDFVCVHPYENLNAVGNGGEAGYLAMVANVRKLLADNKQRVDMPIWITEIGTVTNGSPEQDAYQAQQLMKSYILSIAQGFDRLFWFEVMGPAVYGKEKNNAHGIIRPNGTPRPAFDALKTMTSLLGTEPRYAGWLNIANGGYGFLFDGASGPVLVAWAPVGTTLKSPFPGSVTATDFSGKKAPLNSLTNDVVFIPNPPADLVQQARSNKPKPFPWGGDYTKTDTVRCQLGADIKEEGLQSLKSGAMEVVIIDTENLSCRRLDSTKEGQVNYTFRAHPSFLEGSPRELEITVVARRTAADKPAELKLNYESLSGYKVAPPAWNIPAGDQWQENTWKVQDANFIAQWGYNVSLSVGGSGQCLVKEIRVKKKPGARAK